MRGTISASSSRTPATPVPPQSQVRADIPEDVDRVVLRCLAKDPAGRFPDVESLERALGECACAREVEAGAGRPLVAGCRRGDDDVDAREQAGLPESAFANFLEWHGPMVWGVCNRVLNDSHAAADAFQATFLVLVRRAAVVRIDDSLGRWRYEVSRRIALRAKRTAARHSALERRIERVEQKLDQILKALTRNDR